MMLIIDLPHEVLTYLFRFISGPQLTPLRLVNKKMLDLISQDAVWMDKCNREYNVKNLINWGFNTYYELYTQVLHKFGFLIGIWRAVMLPYGNLIKIEPKDGKLLGLELSAPCPPNISSPLRTKLLFSVEVEDSQVKTLCHVGPNNISHQCNIFAIQGDKSHVKFECCVEAAHRNPGGMRREFEQFMMDESSEITEIIFTGKIELLQKFWVLKKFESGFDLIRTHIPTASPLTIIDAGMYKGDYNMFGYELVLVSFSEDSDTIVASKITGDPNVSGGATAFEISLTAPILLQEDQQTTLSTVQQHEWTLPPNYDELPEQKFIIPQDCLYEGANFPDTCIARYHGKFQVFSTSQNATALFDCHLIVFNKKLFAILTFETKMLYVFYRVEETFL